VCIRRALRVERNVAPAAAVEQRALDSSSLTSWLAFVGWPAASACSGHHSTCHRHMHPGQSAFSVLRLLRSRVCCAQIRLKASSSIKSVVGRVDDAALRGGDEEEAPGGRQLAALPAGGRGLGREGFIRPPLPASVPYSCLGHLRL
jgi:hypothetical protein